MISESNRRRPRRAFALALITGAAVMAMSGGNAIAASGGISANGGSGNGGGKTVPGNKAKLKKNGKAIPPANAPARVKRAIRAANKIDDKPYVYGGGHGRWNDRGYDCSGAVSYVLGPHGAKLLDSPLPSGSFRKWGKKGKGKWITVYADNDHAFVVIAGLRFDTSQPDDGESGPGWSTNIKKGFANVPRRSARHKGKF